MKSSLEASGNFSLFSYAHRDELTERKKAMVLKAFKRMDRDGSGVITASDVNAIYDVSQHPDFIKCKRSRREIIDEFLNGFEGVKGNKDGNKIVF